MKAQLFPQFDLDEIVKPAFAMHKQVGEFSLKWHQHVKHQLLYAEQGVMHLEVAQYRFLLPARHGAWIPATCLHRITSFSPQLVIRTLYFDTDQSDGDILKQAQPFPISDLAHEMIVYTERWEAGAASNEQEQIFFQAIRSLVPDWLANALPLVLPTSEHARLQAVIEFIGKHLEESLTLKRVAQECAFSERTLSRLFQKELSMTFSLYVRTFRIIRALEYLTHPGASVTDAAYAVGYESLSAFSHTFFQLVGIRPQMYCLYHLKHSKLSGQISDLF